MIAGSPAQFNTPTAVQAGAGIVYTVVMGQRVRGIERDHADAYAKSVFDAQERQWGAPLITNLVYARRPTIFRAVRGMWSGIDASGLIPPALRALVNRRVAFLNRCEF
jgi:hypothetical protein